MNTRITKKIAKDWFVNLGEVFLWYEAVLIVINVVMAIVRSFNLSFFTGFEILEVLSNLGYALMLVLGIVMPLVYQKLYISAGVTRKQLAQGVLLAVVGLAVGMALIHAAVYGVASLLGSSAVAAGLIPLQLVRDILLLTFYYLMGWLIAWAITSPHFIKAALCIVIAAGMLGGFGRLCGDLLVNPHAAPGILPEPAIIAILLVATVAGAFILTRLMQRLPLKAS